ncbi:MAG: hypothetical protein DDG60_12005 [Anaerolineae bacterium]|nr:MAG: hypothetical protein DDG60_12005 [Anaerolineae bacterium]
MSFDISPQQPSGSVLSRWWDNITAPSRQVTDTYERRQAQLVSALALANLLFNGLGALFTPTQTLLQIVWAFGPLLLLSVLAYAIARTRIFRVGAFLTVLGLFSSAYTSIIIAERDVTYSLLVYISLGLAVGSAVLSGWAIFLLLGINAGFVLFGLPAFGVSLPSNLGGALGPLTNLGFLLIILNYFRREIEKQRLQELEQTNRELINIRDSLEQRVEERTAELNRRSTQLEASTLVARSAAMVHNLNELLENVVEQISERFGYYHVSIFLTDPSERFVVLEAASSEGGKKLLRRGYKAEIGRQGIVGYAAYQQRPRIVQDVSTESTYIYIPELPETRSEIALPLIVRNNLIGVLDIQSEERNGFKFDDIYTLQNMADQIALAIDNTRLLEESQTRLQQLQALSAASAASAWQVRLQGARQGVIYTPLGLAPLTESTPSTENPDEKTISIPLSLRGKTIGAISLKRKANDPNWIEAEREMAERIAGQVALAIENARILEESQRRAAREQKVSEFSNRFSRSLDVNALLQNAVRELHALPHVAEVAVLIQPEKENHQHQ